MSWVVAASVYDLCWQHVIKGNTREGVYTNVEESKGMFHNVCGICVGSSGDPGPNRRSQIAARELIMYSVS